MIPLQTAYRLKLKNATAEGIPAMSSTAQLRGITWNHSRGYLPLVATAQRMQDRDPSVQIEWSKRSLKDFGDYPIERLIDQFDLLIIDHPFAGYAAEHPVLIPLDEHLPAEFLADQAANSVGPSHASYSMGGHQWALAVDAATPVSGWRPDVLERAGVAVPESWEDLLALARRGLVIAPAAAVDSLMNLYMLCLGLGEEPFQSDREICSAEVGTTALEMLRELIDLCGRDCIDRNPIRTWETLATSDSAAYCPFAYAYSNYARDEFGPNRLAFGGLVSLNGRRLRSTLGGTGLAISATCRDLPAALRYVEYTASPECQRTLYATHGGQPGHRAAWLDPELNLLTHGFFRDTLATHDEAHLRPRYPGYIPFQDQAGDVVRDYLRDGGSARAVLDRLNILYRESRDAA
jgi:multiple sugar transport system substrate-binding protein